MKIQVFDGGQVSRPEPQFLELNEAATFVNINNSLRSLTPVKTKVNANIPADSFNYFFDIENRWLSSAVRRDYVSYQGELYYTDGVQPKVIREGTTYNIGLPQPTSKPGVSPSTILEAVKTIRFQQGTAGDLPLDKLYYKFVNDNGSYYSSVFNTSIDLSNSRAEILDDEFDEVRESIGTVVDNTGSVTIQPPEGLEYASEGIKVFRQYKDKWHLIGTFTDPGVGPIQSVVDSTLDISTSELLQEEKIAPLSGTIQYLYTYYSTSTGLESAASPLSTEVEVEGTILVNNIELPTDPRVDKIRVYRVGGNLTSFTLIKELGITEVSFTDNTRDVDAIGDLLSSSLNTPAPSNLKYLTEMNAMLFGAEGSQLRFTPIGKPEYWPEVYSIELYYEVTGIGACSSGLIVFTKYKSYIVYGTGPTLLTPQLLDGEQGCVNNASVQQVGSALMWLSTDGICVSDGSPAKVISKSSLGKVNFDVIDSVVHDQVYYLIDSEGLILAHDYRFKPMFKYLDLGIIGLAKGNDRLYGVYNKSLHELFSGEDFEQMQYVSPRFVEGRITEDKTYKKVYVYSNGVIIINIFINDSIVMTKTLSGNQSHQLQVPQDKQRGNYIQFEVEGEGQVLEIEYEVGRGIGHG